MGYIYAGMKRFMEMTIGSWTCFVLLTALKDSSKRSINSDWKIELPGEFELAGTTVRYVRRGLWEKMSAKGPTKTPLHLMVHSHRTPLSFLMDIKARFQNGYKSMQAIILLYFLLLLWRNRYSTDILRHSSLWAEYISLFQMDQSLFHCAGCETSVYSLTHVFIHIKQEVKSEHKWSEKTHVKVWTDTLRADHYVNSRCEMDRRVKMKN